MSTRMTIATLALLAGPALASGPGIFEPVDATTSLASNSSGNFTPGTSAGLGGTLGVGGGQGDTPGVGLASGGGDSEDDRWVELNMTPSKIDGANITLVPTPGSLALVGVGLAVAARRRRA